MLIAFENRIVQQSCLDVSYADSIAQLRDTSAAAAGVGYRQWVYQTCTEFGYFQTSDSGTDRPSVTCFRSLSLSLTHTYTHTFACAHTDGQPFGDGMPLQFSLDQCRYNYYFYYYYYLLFLLYF